MKPFYWALLAALTWGCVPVLEKIGLSKIPVFPGLLIRCLGVILGAIILLVWKHDVIRESLVKVTPAWGYLIAGGFLASVVGQIFFYNALKDGEASKVVPLAASYPLISFLIGVIFLAEKLTLAKVGGLLFIILGVVLLK